MTFYLRFIVIQAVLVAGLIALWLSGYFKIPFSIEALVFSCIVLSYGVLGTLFILFKRFSDAAWIANMAIRMGIAGMQLCAIVGLGLASKSIMAGNMEQAGGVFLGSMALALVVSFLALCVNMWVEHSLRLLGHRDEE